MINISLTLAYVLFMFLVTRFSCTNTLLSSKFIYFLKCLLSMLPFWLNLQKDKSEIVLLNNPDLAT